MATTTTKTLQVWWELASGTYWLVVNGEPTFRYTTDSEAREVGQALVDSGSHVWL